MINHSPGPWVSVPSDAGYEDFDIKTADDEWFVATAHAVPGNGDPKANGDLIAAAPDLLAALKRMVNEATRATLTDHFPKTTPLEDAVAAIARAEGES